MRSLLFLRLHCDVEMFMMQLWRDCWLCCRSWKFLVFHHAKLPEIE